MNEELRRQINNEFERKFGISLDEFEILEFEEQQKLIKKNKKSIKKDNILMIGSGEHAVFVEMNNGDTFEKSRNQLEDKWNDISKPVVFVKKLTRKNRNRWDFIEEI